jgi:subtilisin family serine protease
MTRIWRFFIFIFFVLLQISETFGGIGSLRQRWAPGRQISVCFFGGSPEVRSNIAKVAQEWIDRVSISLDFGRPGKFSDCNDKPPYDIRIGFEERGNWSYVGTDTVNVSAYAPTINFETTRETRESPGRKEILEEFGHALGILHQEQDPTAGCRAEVDFEYFRAAGGFSNSEIEHLLLPPTKKGSQVADNGDYISTGLDMLSVMRLLTRPEFFKKGEKSRCYGPPTDTLSAGDVNLIRRLYPQKPSDVRSDSPSQITVRFEGALAAEHFGYVLSALYRDRRVAIRQHISLKDETIGEVILNERLAPKGITAPSLEEFLCQINTHVCTQSKSINVWSNTYATKNYVDQGVACGDRSLPKYVLCIPNIRLEPYDSVTTILYDGRQGRPLKEVIDRLGGCASWDDTCRDLIKRLNATYEDKFLPGADFLPKSFSGELRVPVRSYRLVIEYSDSSDKRNIEKIISDVISTRAAQLQVDRDKIAIEVTNPIGNPKFQQVTGVCTSHTPATYKEPVVTLGSPYADDAGRATLRSLVATDVGIWDTHVDDNHCILGSTGAIYPTYVDPPAAGADPSAAPAPPDRSASCGIPRPSDYRFRLRYDHGTAVAGILVGKGNGVIGVNSDMRVWAYELLSGDQINKGDPILNMISKLRLETKVINVSQTFPANTDSTKTSLEVLLMGSRSSGQGWQSSILFAAAAGISEGESIGRQIDEASSSECRAYPACWSNFSNGARGIISVVALNNSGDDLLKDPGGQPLTNFGLAFDVSAVGDTTSAYYGNYIGPVCGSSFATPYVAGLAALLFGKVRSKKAPWPTPVDVKERILATADRLSSVNDSRFGRVNYSRALNFENDLLQFKPIAQCPSGSCSNVSIDRDRINLEDIRVISGTLDGAPTGADTIPFKRIRRLTSDGDGLFTVRYVDPVGKLRMLERAQITTTGTKFLKSGATSFALDLSSLQEFVACSLSCRSP